MPRQFVTSNDLAAFFISTRRDAQELLPLLLRKLILATTAYGTLGRLGMPGGDDIRLPGWDGHAVLSVSHPYIPLGESAWEMGIASDPQTKADGDYEKRSKTPRGVDPSDTTFVFVTPQVWAGKQTWADARKTEGKWKDVRVIDGQVLSEWFDLAPTVASWFREENGTPIDDIDDVDTGWIRFVEALFNRDIPPALVIGGRCVESERLNKMT